jgi:hypothetical protein
VPIADDGLYLFPKVTDAKHDSIDALGFQQFELVGYERPACNGN